MKFTEGLQFNEIARHVNLSTYQIGRVIKESRIADSKLRFKGDCRGCTADGESCNVCYKETE